MKILPLDNKQNVNSKAFFKQNDKFKTLYGKHEFLYDTALREFKALPNHELEITELFLNKLTKDIHCTVFNNTTKKAISTELNDFASGINDLLMYLTSSSCKDLFKSGLNQANLFKFNILTKNDREDSK